MRTGRLDRGMPKFDFNDSEFKTLTAHLRGLASGTIIATGGPARGGRGGGSFQPYAATLKLQDGRRTLDGTVTSSTPFSATLLTADGKFHLLARSGETYTERPIEPKRDWPSYDGGENGNRYSSLEQINTTNVKRLAPAWIFPVPGAPGWRSPRWSSMGSCSSPAPTKLMLSTQSRDARSGRSGRPARRAY